jgi:hypothetical protein
MNHLLTCLIISIVSTALIVTGIPILPTAHASPCGVPPVGLICAHPQTYRLPGGVWSAHVNSIDAILNISSVTVTGNIKGTLYTGNTTIANSSIISLCSAAHPCSISGSFNARSGKISFASSPTIPTFAAVKQSYTGYLSQRTLVDVTQYTIDGIGITIKPVAGQGFGWDAHKLCLVIGPCLGGSG